jgi:hypothetical protein
MFLVSDFSGRSVISASHCTSTVVDFRHQRVKETIPMGRLERKWFSHILETINKRNSWQETEKERLQEDRRDRRFVHRPLNAGGSYENQLI